MMEHGALFLVRLRWKVPYFLHKIEAREYEWVDKKTSATRFEKKEAQRLAREHGALIEFDMPEAK
jgi:hypothetical protein